MPEQNGPPAEDPAPDGDRVSTAALVAAMELIRGMSGNPAATPGDQLMDDIRGAEVGSEQLTQAFAILLSGSCRCSTTPRSLTWRQPPWVSCP